MYIEVGHNINRILIFVYTVKPVLRGHLWDKDKVVI